MRPKQWAMRQLQRLCLVHHESLLVQLHELLGHGLGQPKVLLLKTMQLVRRLVRGLSMQRALQRWREAALGLWQE